MVLTTVDLSIFIVEMASTARHAQLSNFVGTDVNKLNFVHMMGFGILHSSIAYCVKSIDGMGRIFFAHHCNI